jgi:hypothetical protein
VACVSKVRVSNPLRRILGEELKCFVAQAANESGATCFRMKDLRKISKIAKSCESAQMMHSFAAVLVAN